MHATESIILVIAPLVAYLCGAIPFSLLIGFARGVDIRLEGSKNIGATNLGRVMGLKRYFWYGFLLDALKGFTPVLACALLAPKGYTGAVATLISAVAAVLGHIFPIFLRFRGGKGIATMFGATLGVWPLYTFAMCAALVAFIFIFLVYRYISLASICGALLFPLAVAVLGRTNKLNFLGLRLQPWYALSPFLAVALSLALLVVYRHRANIRRLRAGTEPRFGEKKQPASPT